MIAPSPPFDLSEEQRAAVEYADGDVYVAAGPGTGKTHLLVGRFRQLLATGVPPERILVLTFSRRAADELRERIGGEAEVRTFHGFAARAIEGGTARFRSRRLLDGFARELVLDAAIATAPLASLPPAARVSRGFRAEVARFLEDLGRTVPETLARLAALPDPSPRLADLLALQRTFVGLRERLRATDLDDLVARAVAALNDPQSPAARWLSGRYDHVLVDEFQDTDRVQLALLEALGARIFAVGDEAQSIYRFRGAQHGIVSLALERLALRPFGLTVSRRCPPAVCELAAETPFVGAGAPRSARDGGEPVEVCALRTPTDEVHLVADRVEAALAEGTPPGEIAVLLRATRPFGPLLADELRRRAIPVAENGRDALLADQRIGALRAAFDVLSAPADAQAWRRLLTASPLGLDPLAVRLAGPVLEALRPDPSLSGALSAAGFAGRLAPDTFARAMTLAAAAWNAGDLGLAARRLARNLGLLGAVVRDEPPGAVRAAAERLRAVCDGLAAAQRTQRALGRDGSPCAILAAFDEHAAAFGESSAPGDLDAVRILTVHGAKGLEFELVIIADAIDGRFPQHARRSTLLTADDRALLLAHGVDGASVTDAVDQEEASLWFVAVTRAKERLLITYAREALDGGEQRPSRFLGGRAAVTLTRVERGPLEIEALRCGDDALRARLREDRRIAASPALAAYAADGASAFAAIPPRPLALPGSISVGDAVTWCACPRRLFYTRFLGLRDEPSTAQSVGTALHAVLQRFHTEQRDFTAVGPGAADAWTSRLRAIRRELWTETTFDAPAIAEAAAAFADRVLAAYADALESRARATPFVVDACERAIEFTIGPLTLRGRIDRVDRRLADDGLLLVDYKSGKAKHPPFRKALAKAAAESWDKELSLAGTASDAFAAQLAFYAGALEGVAEFAYVYLKGNGKDGEAVTDTTQLDEGTRAAIAQLLGDVRANLAEPLAAGAIETVPTAASAAACTFCRFTTICPGPQGDAG